MPLQQRLQQSAGVAADVAADPSDGDHSSSLTVLSSEALKGLLVFPEGIPEAPATLADLLPPVIDDEEEEDEEGVGPVLPGGAGEHRVEGAMMSEGS